MRCSATQSYATTTTTSAREPLLRRSCAQRCVEMRAAALRHCLRQPLPTCRPRIVTSATSRAATSSRWLSSATTRPCGDCGCAVNTFDVEPEARWTAPVGAEQEVTAAAEDRRAPQSPTAGPSSTVTSPSSPAPSSTPQLLGAATASAPPSAVRQRCDPYEQNGLPLSDAVVQQLLATLQPGWFVKHSTLTMHSTDDRGGRRRIHSQQPLSLLTCPPASALMPLLRCVHAGSTMRAASG